MQGKRTRALDSRGRPVPGLYRRDHQFIAGYWHDSRWRMQNLNATTLTEARRERDSLLAGLREHRVAAPAATTFADLIHDYQQARNLSTRTLDHERHLVRRHLDALETRKAQNITAADIARTMRRLRDRNYSGWTQVGVYRLLKGAFSLAVRRGTITRSPVDGLAPSEIPKQRNQRKIRILHPAAIDELVAAPVSARWQAAIGLAAYAGLRLGEVRALTWADIDLTHNTIRVHRSLLPDGTAKPPKTEAGNREIPLLPTLRRLLAAWKLETPHTRPHDFVVCTATAGPVEERNLRRALEQAKQQAGFTENGERLSWHSLRHSYASMLATDLELPATTLARLTGHTDAGFTLRIYARDRRDTATIVDDVLTRANGARVGH